MKNWNSELAGIDDEYLSGLANKGIVKRAYKDKETTETKILKIEDEAEIQIGEETVRIKIPLGESRCTCPSRSICRHIILGILVLKESSARTEDEAGKDSFQDTLRKEINAFPTKTLYRTLGTRRLALFQNKAMRNLLPETEESATVITVRLPEEEATVKLLSPLEYSSCTCHKKELCVHKAEALLWCQLQSGKASLKAIEDAQKKEVLPDLKLIRKAAGQMKAYLEEILETGLSRIPPDVVDSLERFAIISHNAGLAKYEGDFRALASSYQSYLKRQAGFQIGELTRQFANLYQKVEFLLKTEDAGELAKQAGEFKSDYLPAGDLDLTGITMEHFESDSGYEGETVYFLEDHTKEWYTYTAARPVFYEKSGKRGRPEKAEAPWGLPCSLEDMIRLRIHLTGAKCDSRNRLSSSKETKGDITGEKRPRPDEIAAWYYDDFEKLFTEKIPKPEILEQEQKLEQGGTDGQSGKRSELVLIQPAFCKKASFSQTKQQLSMVLYDKEKRELILEIAYSKREDWGIRYLERINVENPPCFIGKIYLKDGRIHMYPVDTIKI